MARGNDGRVRCWWCGDDPLYVQYHDEEWGRPTTDELELFELLCLEGAQAGLAWITILRKREGYRRAFAAFDPETVAAFGDDDVERLMSDRSIVRNRAKITAIIGNARALLDLHAAERTLRDLVWSHQVAPRPEPLSPTGELPVTSPEAVELTRKLKRLGFRFVGPTIVYAFLQSAGVVDDHLLGCWRAPNRV
ncbi:MAG: DNA-3-methyladenine glycosylase I [Acidimicrobiia bacterium]|nr:DNA-3-methyladenine glycosylase I [Acidimicrobiia bacterium]